MDNLSKFSYTVKRKEFRIPDYMPISVYKVTCGILYGKEDYSEFRHFVIISKIILYFIIYTKLSVKPLKLYIGPNQIKLNDKIRCYPYVYTVSKDMQQVKVHINYTITIDSDVTELLKYKPYVPFEEYLIIKEEGSFGLHEAHCKATVHIFNTIHILETHFNFIVIGK